MSVTNVQSLSQSGLTLVMSKVPTTIPGARPTMIGKTRFQMAGTLDLLTHTM
jgi:hypothetical protein